MDKQKIIQLINEITDPEKLKIIYRFILRYIK